MYNSLIWIGGLSFLGSVFCIIYFFVLKTRLSVIDSRLKYLDLEKPDNILVKLYKKLNVPIKRDLRRSGLNVKITPERMLIIMSAIAFVGCLIGIVLNNFMVVIMLGIAGFIAPLYWLKTKAQRKQNQITELSSVCIHVLITSFHFGVSLPHLEIATKQMPLPIKVHFDKVVSQLLAGQPNEQIYQEFCDKVENKYLRFALKNILISLSKGTDVLAILFSLMDSVQYEKVRIAKIEKTASEATFMSIVSMGIMLLIIGGYSILSPQFLEVYVTTLAGKIAVAALVGVIIFALYTFERIKHIKV